MDCELRQRLLLPAGTARERLREVMSSAERTLTATRLPILMFSASKTTAMPPRPISLVMRYLPTRTVPIGILEVGSAAIVTGTLGNELLGLACASKAEANLANVEVGVVPLIRFPCWTTRCTQRMPVQDIVGDRGIFSVRFIVID